jgi:uncharacterized protein (TIGR03435 family)
MRKPASALTAVMLCLWTLWAQTERTPQFDVASVRPASHFRDQEAIRGGGPGTTDPSRFADSNATILTLLMTAYGLRKEQISGPDWLRTREYAITATMPPDTTFEQFQLMLRSLLAERFGLVIHHQTKDLMADALVVASGGPKLAKWTAPGSTPAPARKTTDKTIPPGLTLDAKGFPILPTGVSFGYAWTYAPQWMVRASCRGCTMAEFTDYLGHGLIMRAWYDPAITPAYKLPLLVDRTGLSGKFNFTLEFGQLAPPHAPHESGEGLTLFTAMEKQLGLKVERGKKAPMDSIVVDKAEKIPTDN